MGSWLTKIFQRIVFNAFLPGDQLRSLLAVLLGVLLGQSSAGATEAGAIKASRPAPIQVMILGSYHMDSPGLDVVNIQVDDVTQPKRQREIALLVEQLARFAPTKVAVEMEPRPDIAAIAAYEKFTPADLLKDRNEITQIGFRLAHRMKHRSVFAIDEQSKTVDYFPFDKAEAFAKANGQATELATLKSDWQAEGARQSAMQKRLTVSQILRELNAPQAIERDQSAYVSLLAIGGGADWVGADLNAAWYLRNAKIQAKLMKLAKPGDRIVVLYGARHNYWLRELVRTTPGFVLVEPRTYLR